MLTTEAPLAVDEKSLYGFTDDGLLVRIAKNHAFTTILATAETKPVDLVVDSGFVYWLEEGPAIERCSAIRPACHHGYEMKGGSRPKGQLLRIPIAGGTRQQVAIVPDGKGLTVLRGAVWVTSVDGTWRIDPSVIPADEHAILQLPDTSGGGRPSSIGDGLLLAKPGLRSRVVLVSAN
jgi:hypothetical protein